MKKAIYLLILAITLACAPAYARKNITRDIKVLPAQAQQFLRQHFPKHNVSHIKIEKEVFEGTSYDVVLNNGNEIEFDSKGNWTDIDCGTNAVPNGIIMKEITRYIRKNYSGRSIVQIEKSSGKYEIELSDGTDLEFGRDGKFRRVDN